MSFYGGTRGLWPSRPEVPRSSKGKRVIPCHLYAGEPHGSHRYIRGDETVVCRGLSREQAWK